MVRPRALGFGGAAAALSACTLFTDLDGFDSQASTASDASSDPDAVVVAVEGGSSLPEGGPSQEAGPALAPYPAAVMADAPILYYRFDDPVAPAAKDASGKGHDGVYKGGVVLGAPGATADGNTAAEFDGQDDVVEVTNLPSAFAFAGKATYSIEVWAKRTDATKAGLLSKGYYDGAKYQGLYLEYNGNGTTLESFRAGSPGVSTAAPANDVFAHVVVTFDGFTLVLYVDGAQASTRTNQLDLTATTEPLLIGLSTYWGRFKGTLDELAIYDKPLPPARVRAHFDAAKLK